MVEINRALEEQDRHVHSFYSYLFLFTLKTEGLNPSTLHNFSHVLYISLIKFYDI